MFEYISQASGALDGKNQLYPCFLMLGGQRGTHNISTTVTTAEKKQIQIRRGCGVFQSLIRCLHSPWCRLKLSDSMLRMGSPKLLPVCKSISRSSGAPSEINELVELPGLVSSRDS